MFKKIWIVLAIAFLSASLSGICYAHSNVDMQRGASHGTQRVDFDTPSATWVVTHRHDFSGGEDRGGRTLFYRGEIPAARYAAGEPIPDGYKVGDYKRDSSGRLIRPTSTQITNSLRWWSTDDYFNPHDQVNTDSSGNPTTPTSVLTEDHFGTNPQTETNSDGTPLTRLDGQTFSADDATLPAMCGILERQASYNPHYPTCYVIKDSVVYFRTVNGRTKPNSPTFSLDGTRLTGSPPSSAAASFSGLSSNPVGTQQFNALPPPPVNIVPDPPTLQFLILDLTDDDSEDDTEDDKEDDKEEEEKTEDPEQQSGNSIGKVYISSNNGNAIVVPKDKVSLIPEDLDVSKPDDTIQELEKLGGISIQIPQDKIKDVTGSLRQLEEFSGEDLTDLLPEPEPIPRIPPKPKEWICDKGADILRQEIRITNVTMKKKPKRLIVTFENSTGRYVPLKDSFMRIALLDEDRRIKSLKHIKSGNSLGNVYLKKSKDESTVGVLTLSWYINRKRYSFKRDEENYDASFAAALSWYNIKTGESLYNPEKDSIVLLYFCEEYETIEDYKLDKETDFRSLKRGDIVEKENIIAEYSEKDESVYSAPSLITKRKMATTWGSLKMSK